MTEIDFSLILACTDRSRAYLSALKSKGYRPAHVILLGEKFSESYEPEKETEKPEKGFIENFPEMDFEIGFSIDEFLLEGDWSFVKMSSSDVNTQEVVDEVSKITSEVVVYSGYPGVIVRDPLIDVGKVLLHVHPGKLPEFRGSTTIYYSLLEERPMTFSAIALNKVIDGGRVIHEEFHPAPEDRRLIDKYVDHALRARTLVNALRKFSCVNQPQSLGKIGRPDDSLNYAEYFVIHPVLKHLAIMSEAREDE